MFKVNNKDTKEKYLFITDRKIPEQRPWNTLKTLGKSYYIETN